jgi:hypothetical protein
LIFESFYGTLFIIIRANKKERKSLHMQLPDSTLKLLKTYANLGFQVFPCYEVRGNICACSDKENCSHAGKHPKVPWTDPVNCTNDYDTMVDWFSNKFHGSNIAVNCSLSNIWVIDIDTKNGAGGMESYSSLIHEFDIPPETRQHITPSGGFHIFFKQDSDNLISTTAGAYPGIDIRGVGGYVLLPPSQAPANDWKKTHEPRVTGDYTDRGEDAISEISLPNDKWLAAFEGLTARTNDKHIDRTTINLDEIDDAEINPQLESWGELERCLSHIPSSCIGIPEQKDSAFAVYFKILGAIADACPGKKGLDLAMRWSGAISLDGRAATNYHSPSRVQYEFYRARNGNDRLKNQDNEIISSFRSIFQIAKDIGCGHNLNWWGGLPNQYRRVTMDCQPPEDSVSPDIMIASFQDFGFKEEELDTSDDLKLGEANPPVMPDLELEGAVKYAYDYINSINPSKVPLLSILPALSIVAASTNRTFRLNGLRTVIFTMNSAGAGGGKNAGIKACTDLLTVSGCERFLSGDPRSAPALHTKLATDPNLLLVIDELADKLRPMFDEKNTGYSKELLQMILEAYSVGGGKLKGMMYRDAENDTESVENPHLNIFGVLVDSVIQDIINKKQIQSGFVRRFLINWSPLVDDPEYGADIITPNHDAMARFKEWRDIIFRQTSLGNIADIQGRASYIDLIFKPHTPAYDVYWEEFQKMRKLQKSYADSDYESIFFGWRENVQRVAMILCAANWHLDPNPEISAKHIRTAAKIVTNSCKTWVYFFRHHVANGDIDKYVKILVRELNTNKQEGVSLPDFRNRMRMPKKMLYEEVVSLLVDNGGVLLDNVPNKTKDGRRIKTPTVWNVNYLPQSILDKRKAEKEARKPKKLQSSTLKSVG